MQSVSSRIWTRVAVSISYEYNHYTTGTSLYIYIYIYIVWDIYKLRMFSIKDRAHIDYWECYEHKINGTWWLSLSWLGDHRIKWWTLSECPFIYGTMVAWAGNWQFPTTFDAMSTLPIYTAMYFFMINKNLSCCDQQIYYNATYLPLLQRQDFQFQPCTLLITVFQLFFFIFFFFSVLWSNFGAIHVAFRPVFFLHISMQRKNW